MTLKGFRWRCPGIVMSFRRVHAEEQAQAEAEVAVGGSELQNERWWKCGDSLCKQCLKHLAEEVGKGFGQE